MTTYDRAKNSFNKLMNASGYEHRTIGEKQSEGTEKWNISDMVSECQYVLNTYYETGHANNEASNRELLKEKYGNEEAEEMYIERIRSIRRLKTFIQTYEEFTLMEKPTEKHGTKYDDAMVK